MAKPIAGINDYPYGVCGYVVDGVHLRDGTTMKSLRIYKQRSDVMYDLIDPKTNNIYQKVLITGQDKNGAILDYNKSNDEILSVIPKNTFFIRGYNDLHTREGFVVRFLLNKVILSTGRTLYDMYTPTCEIPLPNIENIILDPIQVNDTSISGSISSSSGPINPDGMIVKITLPDGTEYETTVDGSGNFTFSPVQIDSTGEAVVTITSPNYNDAQVTVPVLADDEDSDYVSSIKLSPQNFISDGSGNFNATIPASLHHRGADLVIQLQQINSDVMFSSVSVNSTGDITITQTEASSMEVIIIGKTLQTAPHKESLVWIDNLDGTFSCSISQLQHTKQHISFSIYEGTSIVTVEVQIDDSDNLVLTSLENFTGYIVITGK